MNWEAHKCFNSINKQLKILTTLKNNYPILWQPNKTYFLQKTQKWDNHSLWHMHNYSSKFNKERISCFLIQIIKFWILSQTNITLIAIIKNFSRVKTLIKINNLKKIYNNNINYYMEVRASNLLFKNLLFSKMKKFKDKKNKNKTVSKIIQGSICLSIMPERV